MEISSKEGVGLKPVPQTFRNPLWSFTEEIQSKGRSREFLLKKVGF
jgi:hypothetical protein